MTRRGGKSVAATAVSAMTLAVMTAAEKKTWRMLLFHHFGLRAMNGRAGSRPSMLGVHRRPRVDDGTLRRCIDAGATEGIGAAVGDGI